MDTAGAVQKDGRRHLVTAGEDDDDVVVVEARVGQVQALYSVLA